MVIGLGHHLIAGLGKDSIDYVYFDAHSDDNINGDNTSFSCANFINFMAGKHYVVGVGRGVYPNGNKTRWFRCNEAEKISKQPLRDRIFLSYDIDVFDPSITTAHAWGSGEMLPKQVKDLSAKITEGRNLVGMNVASYNPSKEANQNYKTIGIILDILQPRL